VGCCPQETPRRVVSDSNPARSRSSTCAPSRPPSDPPAEDVDKLKNYVGVIENEIEVQAKTHREQEDGAKATQQAFSDLIKKNEI